MKILHISTYGSGGGGIAALRLHNALLNNGIESSYLCLENAPFGENVFSVPPFKLSTVNVVLRKLGLYKTEADKNWNSVKNLKGNYEFFSFPRTNYDLSQHPLVQNADIINLHWVNNFIDYSFFAKINKNIVWTLHDMNPFQGGFHYYNDVIENKEIFGKIENDLLQYKKRFIHQVKDLEIVTLSSWMYEASSHSEMFSERPHHLIRNSIDFSIFKNYTKTFAREVFNLPQDKTVLLFVSEIVTNKRKGLDLLLDALSELDASDIYIAAIGNVIKDIKSKHKINYLGKISDQRAMALLYAAADACMLTSREDNLPNVMLESLACGTPVISTPVGGMLDIIKPGFNGFLAEDISPEGIRKAIEEFLKKKDLFVSEKIRQSASEIFSPDIQAKKYIKIYQNMLNK
jgi:glycosyltransferase involved in cell wall biosynthesis